jgi:hypothetical protein
VDTRVIMNIVGGYSRDNEYWAVRTKKMHSQSRVDVASGTSPISVVGRGRRHLA